MTIGAALQDLAVVAHNAEFDVEFLRAEFTRAGMPMPRFSTYCTLQGSTLYLPQLRRRTLAQSTSSSSAAAAPATTARPRRSRTRSARPPERRCAKDEMGPQRSSLRRMSSVGSSGSSRAPASA